MRVSRIKGRGGRLCVRGKVDERASRPNLPLRNTSSTVMSPSKLHTLYKQLVRAFTSQPSDLKTSGRLLAELKVRLVCVCHAFGLTDAPFCQVVLIETGLIFPQTDYSTQDLVIAREYYCLPYRPAYALCLINHHRGDT
jgi:hypothetical protein